MHNSKWSFWSTVVIVFASGAAVGYFASVASDATSLAEATAEELRTHISESTDVRPQQGPQTLPEKRGMDNPAAKDEEAELPELTNAVRPERPSAGIDTTQNSKYIKADFSPKYPLYSDQVYVAVYDALSKLSTPGLAVDVLGLECPTTAKCNIELNVGTPTGGWQKKIEPLLMGIHESLQGDAEEEKYGLSVSTIDESEGTLVVGIETIAGFRLDDDE